MEASRASRIPNMTNKGSLVTPRLLGWNQGEQNDSGMVPGGFLVFFLSWEKVPGVRLGDYRGATEFWKLDDKEREDIRIALQKTLPLVDDLLLRAAS